MRGAGVVRHKNARDVKQVNHLAQRGFVRQINALFANRRRNRRRVARRLFHAHHDDIDAVSRRQPPRQFDIFLQRPRPNRQQARVRIEDDQRVGGRQFRLQCLQFGEHCRAFRFGGFDARRGRRIGQTPLQLWNFARRSLQGIHQIQKIERHVLIRIVLHGVRQQIAAIQAFHAVFEEPGAPRCAAQIRQQRGCPRKQFHVNRRVNPQFAHFPQRGERVGGKRDKRFMANRQDLFAGNQVRQIHALLVFVENQEKKAGVRVTFPRFLQRGAGDNRRPHFG